MAPRTAADLPSEIVHAIVSRALGSEPRQLYWRGKFQPGQLKALSLTCRYWALLCRLHIFYTVTLRGLRSLESLAVLLSSPSTVKPRLADCVRCVRVIQNGALCAPWLHRVDTVLRPLLPEIEHFTLRLSNVDDLHHVLPSRLPRTMPVSFFSFRALDLDKVHFSKASDFVRLLATVPSVETVHCNHIVFNDPPSLTEQEVLLSVPQKHSLKRIFVSRAENITSTVLIRLLLTCFRLRANRLFYMPPGIWNAILAAMSTLWTPVSGLGHGTQLILCS